MSQSPPEQDKSCSDSVNSNNGQNQDQVLKIIETSLSSNSKNDPTSTNLIEKSVVKKIDFSIESLLRIPYQEPESNLHPNHSAIEFREKLNFFTFTNCFHLQNNNNKRRRTGREGGGFVNSSLSRDYLEPEKVVEESENHVDYDNKYNSNEEEEEEGSQCKSEGDEQSCDERVEIEKGMEIDTGNRRITSNQEEEEETETLSETEETTHKEFSWLYCSRFKPPKLPRSKKRGGCKRYGRGPRIPFAPHQITVLENAFKKSQYLSTDCISRLAETLFLSENRVKIWFQNRRARFRRENSDQDISNMLMDKHATPVDSSLNSPAKGKKSTSPTKHVSISNNNNNSILLASPSHSNGSRKRLNNNNHNNNTNNNTNNNNNSNWTSTTNVNNNNNNITSPNTLSFFPFQLERPHNMFLNAETHFHNEKNNNSTNIIQHTSLTSPYNSSGSREFSSEFIQSTISANAHFNRILYGTSASAFAPIRR